MNTDWLLDVEKIESIEDVKQIFKILEIGYRPQPDETEETLEIISNYFKPNF